MRQERLSIGDSWRAARAVASADGYRTTRPSLRPPGVTGLFAGRAPLTLQILRAARERRLIWGSADEFVIVEPLAGPERPASVLRVIDTYWDALVFLFVPLLLLGSAVLLALLAPSVQVAGVSLGLWFVLAAVLFVATGMVMVVGARQSRRTGLLTWD